MLPGLLQDMYGDEWPHLVHRVVLEAALDVAWARTRLLHPRVKDVETFKRFTTGSHRVRRAMRSLGVEERIIKEGRPGLNPVEALADRMVEARTSPCGSLCPRRRIARFSWPTWEAGGTPLRTWPG